MSLAVNPATCTVPAAGGNSTHQLANSGAEKLFKVKSSNNNEYPFKPQAEAATAIEVIHVVDAAKETKGKEADGRNKIPCTGLVIQTSVVHDVQADRDVNVHLENNGEQCCCQPLIDWVVSKFC